MPLDSEQLRQTLDRLHQQLEEAERLDPDVAARLRATMDDIRTVLDQQASLPAENVPLSAPPPAEPAPTVEPAAGEEPLAQKDVAAGDVDEEPTIAQRLSEAEQQFASSHPTLSNSLQRLVDMLAQMGI